MLDPKWFIDSFDPGPLLDAVASWRNAADRAEEHRDTLGTKVGSNISANDSEWTGAAAVKAGDLYDKLTSRMEGASEEARLMADLLEKAANGWEDAKAAAKDTITALQGDGLTYVVNGTGGDTTIKVFSSLVEGDDGTHRPQSPGAEADYSSAIDEWEAAYGKEYHSTCKAHSTALMDAIIDAIEVDEDLAVVLRESFTSGDDLKFHTDALLDPDQAAGLPDDDATPEEVNDWWDGLSEEDQQYFIDEYPEEIGDLDGVPVTARDEANRIYIDQRQEEIDEELAQLHEGKPGKTEDYLAQVEELEKEKAFLESVKASANDDSDGQTRYVIDFDSQERQAAVSVGNPDTADNTAVFVPGTSAQEDPGYQFDRAAALTDEANTVAPDEETATVMWLGYDAPDHLGEAAYSDYADDGALKLNNFMDTMETTHEGGSRRTTVIGHSYGSSVVGTADAQGDGLGADDVVLVGSPGAGYEDAESGSSIGHADDMNTANENIWAASAGDDPVTYASIHGANPVFESFGGQRMETDTSGHSSYWDTGSKSLENQARIVAGQHDKVTEEEHRW